MPRAWQESEVALGAVSRPATLNLVTAAGRHSFTGLAVGSLTVALAAALVGCTPTTSQSALGQRQDSPSAQKPAAASDSGPTSSGPNSAGAFQLAPATRRGHLAPGSNPRALPGDVLIADEDNHRLLLVDPQGRIRWEFPSNKASRQGTFGPPDDAFVSPNGTMIVATQEMADTISLINIAQRRVVRRYGHPDIPGSARNFFSHPDDAMLLPGGDLLTADIVNCRILILAPGRFHVVRQFGTTSSCAHDPPHAFGSPNGAFPLTDGHYLITEINGDWVDAIDLRGHVYWSTHPPGVAYPSDSNQAGPGRYITADYSTPGQIVIFNRHGRALWRFRPTGKNALNHPSLALQLPNGNILVNDDYNDRVIVINPRTNRIVWQYGHRGVAGTAPGYLANPDGVDMAPPYSLLIRYAGSMGRP